MLFGRPACAWMSCRKTATQNTFGRPLATDERHRPLYDVEHACIFNFFAGNQKNLQLAFRAKRTPAAGLRPHSLRVTTGETFWAISLSHAVIFGWQPYLFRTGMVSSENESFYSYSCEYFLMCSPLEVLEKNLQKLKILLNRDKRI